MNLRYPSPDFDDAVAAVCDGHASEEQMRALNTVLRGTPAARDDYLFRVELHARIASEPDLFAAPASSKDVAGPGARVNPVPQSQNPVAPSPTSISKFTARRPSYAWVLAMAACFLLLAGGIALWLNRPGNHETTHSAVAMLTRTVDARWNPVTGTIRNGSALGPGWLHLDSGLAQVVFYSGTRVVIEGPAEVQLLSRNEMACRRGRLLAEVPQAARGFRLRTEQLDLVDLGTAFGVDATASRSDIHVFKGTVELHPQAAATCFLAEGQAAAAEASTPVRLMAASAAAFRPLFDFQQRSMASEAYRYEQWQFAGARLNQDPSLVVHLDFENLSGSDWTLRNAAEGNLAVPEATVVGCQRAEGRWREKQALEFQNINDRVRLAVPGEFHDITLAAWVCVKGLDRQFSSLFMCDGFEPGTVHWLIRNDGVLGLTVMGPGSGNYQILASPPVLTPDRLGLWMHLAVVLDGTSGRVTHYANGEPISRHALKFSPPFRIDAAELGNWVLGSGPDPIPELIRNLRGALDEFTLFNRALDEAELRQLYVQGKRDL